MDDSGDRPSDWQAGLAAVNITPAEPIWLSGWSDRSQPSSRVSHPIFAKALALRHANGPISLLVSSDLMAYSAEFMQELVTTVSQKFSVPRERLVLCATHNHSAPVTTNVLPLYYDMTAEQLAVVDRYSQTLPPLFIEAIGEAIDRLSPATLQFGQNIAGFAINRRRHRTGGRSLPGPVDHDVPVLCIRDSAGMVRGVVFGYACHTTSVKDGTLNADYAGFAQSELERMYPGAVAMFLAGCGGDAGTNPRCMKGLSEAYGHILATAVNDVLIERMAEPVEPVLGPLGASFGVATLKLAASPTREEFVRMLPTLKGKELRKVQHQITKLDAGESLIGSYDYPMYVWRFASGHTMIILSSEVVVDYSLRMKQTYGFDRTWVAAYANEHIAYIPSERVLKEGGYEGSDGMLECGFPSPFAAGIESTIAYRISQLWEEAGVQLQATKLQR